MQLSQHLAHRSGSIKQYQRYDSNLLRSSQRVSEDEDNSILRVNTNSVSNPDYLRKGEDVRRACCLPINQKSEDALNLDLSIELEDNDRPQSYFHQRATSIITDLGYQPTQQVHRGNSRRGSHLLGLSQVAGSKLQLLVGDRFNNTLGNKGDNKQQSDSESQDSKEEQGEIERRKAENREAALLAERQAILKNSKYETMMNTHKVDPLLGKIDTMWGALNLVVIVASFLNSIKKYGNSYKFKRMKPAEFNIIGDKSSDFGYYFENQYFTLNQPSNFKLFWIKLLKIIDNNPIFMNCRKTMNSRFHGKNTLILPNSMVKIIWDSFILFLLSLNIFYVPIKITWENNQMGGLELNEWLAILLNDLPGWTFLGDIILNFNLAYYSKGIMVYNRKKIVSNYIKTEFLSDLLIVIPFIVSLKLNLVLLNAVLLFRTSKMFKLAQYFEQLMNMKPQQTALFNLFKLVFMIVFVAHFCGCMFFLVGSAQIDYDLADKTWISAAGILEKDWFEQYITSLYWAVITMITIGYGDITPITIYERSFVILITLISCGVFAYSVNQIGHLISALTLNSNELKVRMSVLTRHLRHRGVSHDLQMQVRKYFEYWYKGKEDNDGETCDEMIEQLSNNLRQEVQNDIRFRLIGQMPILQMNFSQQFLRSVASHIKTKRTKPEEVLIEEQSVSDRLYLLVSGFVRSYIGIKKDSFTSYTSMRLYKMNSIFDQVSFMGDLRCLTGYRSVGSCTLYYISKSDFMQELRNFPLDLEKYQLIKDNITIYRSQRNIGTKCHFCEKYTHSFDRCPFIKYIPYAEKHITIYRASIEQIRDEHKRRSFHHSTLESFASTKERAVNYLIENNPFQNEEELIERLELVNIGEEEFYAQIDQRYSPQNQQQHQDDPANNYQSYQHMRSNNNNNNNYNYRQRSTNPTNTIGGADHHTHTHTYHNQADDHLPTIYNDNELEDEDHTSATNKINDDDFTCNPNYPPEFQKNSIILLPLVPEQGSIYSVKQRNPLMHALSAGQIGPLGYHGPAGPTTQIAALHQGTNATATIAEGASQYLIDHYNNTITMKNNSNLNTIFSNNDGHSAVTENAQQQQTTAPGIQQQNNYGNISSSGHILHQVQHPALFQVLQQHESVVESINGNNTASFVDALGGGQSNVLYQQAMPTNKNRKAQRGAGGGTGTIGSTSSAAAQGLQPATSTFQNQSTQQQLSPQQHTRSPRRTKTRAEDFAILKLRQAKDQTVNKNYQLVNLRKIDDAHNNSNEINESTHKSRSSAYENNAAHGQKGRRLQLNKFQTNPNPGTIVGHENSNLNALAHQTYIENHQDTLTIQEQRRSPNVRKISEIHRGTAHSQQQQQQTQQQSDSTDFITTNNAHLLAGRRRSSLSNSGFLPQPLFSGNTQTQQYFAAPAALQTIASGLHQNVQIQQVQSNTNINMINMHSLLPQTHTLIPINNSNHLIQHQQSQNQLLPLHLQQQTSQQQQQQQQQQMNTQNFSQGGGNHTNMNISSLHNHIFARDVFMPVLNFDRMKTFSLYYPSGNYTIVLEKMVTNVARAANPKTRVYDINKLRKSVNKIMHIRQLQNSILKKNLQTRQSTIITPNQLAVPKKGTTINASFSSYQQNQNTFHS